MSLLPEPDSAAFGALLGGADYGEAFLEASEGLSLRFEEGKVEDIGVSSERGLGLRYLRRQGEEIVTYQGSAQELDAAARLREQLLGKAKGPALTLSAVKRHTHIVRQDPSEIPLDRKLDLLRLIDKTLRCEFEEIRQVTLSYGERRRDLAILNSDGANTRERRTAVILSISVVAEKNGMLQTGHEVIGGLKGWEILTDFDPLLFARLAARRAVAKLSAPKAKAGEMPIVLSASAGGTFIHEAIGHSLEVDHVQEGSSPAYKGKVGQVIAPETITVVDDPTMPFYRGSFAFDDEGVESRATPLVKNGVLTDYLYDRVTAMREGKPSNGHGRRESFACRPIPRMSNLYIAPGPDDPREILKNLKAGILVTRMGGGQVNTATGEFVFEVDEGFWVENGKIKHMVRDANLLGIGPDILKSIDKVGWDIGWGIGTCGKDGQGVPVGDGQPTLHIPKILIGGKSE
jgi:TldD protein